LYISNRGDCATFSPRFGIFESKFSDKKKFSDRLKFSAGDSCFSSALAVIPLFVKLCWHLQITFWTCVHDPLLLLHFFVELLQRRC